jgi:hypothetical protein
VRYLGTVDCHWYPEAEAALVAALRTDTNECVRLEAALALSRGCCCTKAVVEALTISVTASTRDKNPSETSPRVRAVAFVALQRCLACPAPAGEETPPEAPEPAPEPREKVPPPREKVPEPREKVPEPGEKTVLTSLTERALPAYYRTLDRTPRAAILAEARRAVTELEQAQLAAGAAAAAPPALMLPTGDRDLLSILRFSWAAPALAPAPTTAEPPPAAADAPSMVRGYSR